MNKQPVIYSQKDYRWKNIPYQVPGETDTIGASGCGPTCAAMLITTLTGKTFTPADACRWSVDHGYKAKGQGTYYSYFEPQFKAFGLNCKMLNWSKTYGNPDHPNHELVEKKLKEGYYAIALMKKGHWTPTGHFVVLWWEDNKCRINDPNSTLDYRVNGDIRTFRSEVQYYWLVDAREYNHPKPKPEPEEVEEDMTDAEVRKIAREVYEKMSAEANSTEATADWEKNSMAWCKARGINDGTRPKAFVTRAEISTMLRAFGKNIAKIFE